MTDHTDIVERLNKFAISYTTTTFHEDLILEAVTEITRLRAEAEALRKDAERYRWLRDRLFGADWDWNNEGVPVVLFRWPDGASIGADLDAAIDAAKGTT